MHYVIETKEQLSFLQAKKFKECFVEVISNHDLYHPALQNISAVPLELKNGYVLYTFLEGI